MSRGTTTTIITAALLGGIHAQAEDWTQWRGPQRTGEVSAENTAWPDSLSDDHLTELWSIDLHESYASPINSGNLVYSVSTEDKKNEIVRAFDLESGEQAWEATWEGAMMAGNLALENLIAFVDLNDFSGLERMSEGHPAFHPLLDKFLTELRLGRLGDDSDVRAAMLS